MKQILFLSIAFLYFSTSLIAQDFRIVDRVKSLTREKKFDAEKQSKIKTIDRPFLTKEEFDAKQETIVTTKFDAFAKLDKTIFDFGKIYQTAEGATATFSTTNIGTTPLILDRVQASCSCMVPNWNKEPIAPDATSVITVKYNTMARPGYCNKTITIYANNEVKEIYIKGIVE
jgi:hypothetical protein